MSKKQTEQDGLERVGTSGTKMTLPSQPRSIGDGLRVTIRGRSVRLRGARRSPTGLLRWLPILGPGLIATQRVMMQAESPPTVRRERSLAMT